MANLKNAKKAIKVIARKTKRNQLWRNKVKEIVKNTRELISKGKDKDVDTKKVYKILDKAAKNRVIHPNKASRLKSKLTKSNKK